MNGSGDGMEEPRIPRRRARSRRRRVSGFSYFLATLLRSAIFQARQR
jgi:hypothetical protein